jgi:tetratricopeptide (TPR) repeat protein
MDAYIKHVGADVLCRSENGSPTELRLGGDRALKALTEWAARYDAAVGHDGEAELLAIGREMFAWLDKNGWPSAWVKVPGPRSLEIRVDDPNEPLERAMLDAPWELLAHQDGHLADDVVQIFEVARRIGPKTEAIAPRHSDLQLIFMAAAPEGQNVLDFEAEEASILEATAGLPLHLVVEESGAAKFLGERLDLDGPFEALHLSCHGEIHPQRGHVLAFEDAFGTLAYADAGNIAGLLGDPERTPLVFLSACRTAEEAGSAGGGARRFEPFVWDLTRAGVANVLGWDGSVYDADAASFARTFYRELARRKRIPRAVAVARQELRHSQREDPQRGRHWHLARFYVGPRGGGALAAGGLPKRKLASDAYEDQFLDKERGEVPVAKRPEFVGRRRQTQRVLKAFREDSAGVLIHGMGNLGKSSLAARIASRMTGHKTVVIFGAYDALTIFDRLVEALPAQHRAGVRATWREAVMADAAVLGDALEDLLDQQPLLVIIDDLERILDKPTQSDGPTPVQQRYRATAKAVLRAFGKARTDSRLLITSRYLFSLPDGRGGDLADGLAFVPLRPMEESDRIKQWRAAARAAKQEDTALDSTLPFRALEAAEGNPGLQAALMKPILKGETAAAEQAIRVIDHFHKTGVPPEAIQDLTGAGMAKDEANAVAAFFQRMAFDTYRKALTPQQAAILRSACLFSSGLPIPRLALEAAGAAAGVSDPGAALDRLLGLGLADDWGMLNETPHAAANPLARPLVDPLDGEMTARLADAGVSALGHAWRDAYGDIPRDPRAVELARLALIAPNPGPALLDNAAEAAGRYLFKRKHDARRAHGEVLQPALAKLNSKDAVPGHGLLLIAYDCAQRLGEREAQDRVLEIMAQSPAQGTDHADFLLYIARRRVEQGDNEAAQQAFAEAATGFLDAGQVREGAIARGQIADILQARGNLDEALRILSGEVLGAFERLGDVRSKAVTQGKIADILQARGNLDEALRIRTEEELPVYERLGDVREKAVTQGKIADILQARGNLDEALALHEQRLPIAESMSNIESIAHIKYSTAVIRLQRGDHNTGGIRQIQEDLSEAFEISLKLGRPDFIGGIGSLFAQILAMGGQKTEALKVLQHAEDAFNKLGNAQGLTQVRELREMISRAAQNA